MAHVSSYLSKVLVVNENDYLSEGIKRALSEFEISAGSCINFEELLDRLDKANLDWLILPVRSEENHDIIHILNLLRDHAKYSHIKVSAVYFSEFDRERISSCLELGCFSYHAADDFLEGKVDSFAALFKYLEKYQGDFRLVSAEFVRDNLKICKQFSDLEFFESNLMNFYPGMTEQIFNIANAKFLASKQDEAFNCIKQIVQIDKSYLASAENFLQKVLPERHLSTESFGLPVNLFSLKSVAIVEPNFEIAKTLYELFTAFGIPQIALFSSPISALKQVEKRGPPDFIVCSHELSFIPTFIFIQRLKTYSDALPILVLGAQFTSNDIVMLKDIGAFAALETPIKEDRIKLVLTMIAQDKINPQSIPSLLHSLNKSVLDADEEAAHLTLVKIANHSHLEPGQITKIKAEISLEFGDSLLGRELALKSLQENPNHPESISILGKALIKEGQLASGLRCLETACMIVPWNGRRHCEIAEAYLEMDNLEAYSDSLDRAQKILRHSRYLRELKLKKALMDHNIEEAKEVVNDVEYLRSIVRWSNGRAIKFIKQGNLVEGSKIYKTILKVLPISRNDLRSIVYFNLGIAMAREEELELAEDYLSKSLNLSDSKLSGRIESILNKVRSSIGSNTPLGMLPPKQDIMAGKLDRLAKIDKVYLSQTDPINACCFGIFIHSENGKRDLDDNQNNGSSLPEPLKKVG